MAQHLVPQHVLRGVSADGKTICQYDKTNQLDPMMVGIKGACGRNDAFSLEVERLLSTIESAANPAIDVFRRMENAMRIDPVTKRIVAVYLTMFLWRRSPAIRDRQIIETTEDELLAMGRDIVRRYGAPLSLCRDRLPAIAARAASDVNGLIGGHWESSSFQRWLFYSMTWAVLRCPEPIVTIPDCGMARSGDGGPLDPSIEFYFPLSANRVLMASWHGAPPEKVQLLTASSAHVRHINKLGFGLAGRFVYAQTRSGKLATAVRRSSRHYTRLQGLQVAGGPNPTAMKLDSLNDWYAKVEADGADDAARHRCMAPGAGDQFRHSWQTVPADVPVAREAPQHKASVRICGWCNALEWRYPNGQVEFDDFELRRTTANEAMQNWWQSFRIESTDTSIRAHRAAPRCRVAN